MNENKQSLVEKKTGSRINYEGQGQDQSSRI